MTQEVLVETIKTSEIESNSTKQYFSSSDSSNLCIVQISLKKNNVFINLTNSKGNTILKFSAGLIQQRKTKKELRSILKYIIDKISFFIKANFDCIKIIINMKSDGSAKKAISFFKYFNRKKIKIVYFKAKLPVVHNGCRSPKKRRL